MLSQVERRIVAAEIALKERLPVIACLFLSNVRPGQLGRAAAPTRRRFLLVAAAARKRIV